MNGICIASVDHVTNAEEKLMVEFFVLASALSYILEHLVHRDDRNT